MFYTASFPRGNVENTGAEMQDVSFNYREGNEEMV